MSNDTQVYDAIAKRILKTTGKQSSLEAAHKLAKEMEEEGLEIADEASVFADHAGRQTIKLKDVEQALKQRE